MLSEAELRKMPCVQSKDFAILLGVEESSMGTTYPNDFTRVTTLISAFIPRLVLEPEMQQNVYLSRLAALYLPQIMKRFSDLPVLTPQESRMLPLWELSNTISYFLVLQMVPVFQHYLRMSSTRTRRITQTQLDRLADKAPMLRSCSLEHQREACKSIWTQHKESGFKPI